MTGPDRLGWAIPRAALLGLMLAACVQVGTPPRPATTPIGPPAPASAITVASFNFPESEVLASIYGRALRRAGYPVQLLQGVGPRELVEPALARGLVDLVPEYAGSALQFLTLGNERPSPDPARTHVALATTLVRRGLLALAAAPGQDANVIVVTHRTASRYGLRRVSDLATVAPHLVFAGPPECPQREFCLQGLKRMYGLRFERFVPLDAGGPLTLQALREGQVDVAVLFSTDPAIDADHLVVLSDDRRLQPAENVTPVVRRDLIAKYGGSLVRVIDGVSTRLSTRALRSLNAEAEVRGASPDRIASRWLSAQGLA
jgi:osmoprotectant transport system substrate-binding protein